MGFFRKIRINEAPNFSGFKGFGGGGARPQKPTVGAQPGSITAAAAKGSVKNTTLSPKVNFCKSVMVTHPQTQQQVEILEAFVSYIRNNE